MLSNFQPLTSARIPEGIWMACDCVRSSSGTSKGGDHAGYRNRGGFGLLPRGLFPILGAT